MPYRPDLKNEVDVSSFESTFTREAPVDSVSEKPDPRASSRITSKRGIMNFFGMGTAVAPNTDEVAMDSDAFKGFSFTKDEANIDNDQNAGTDLNDK